MNTEGDGGDALTTESFAFVCKQVGLTMDDLEIMDIGDILDYIETYIEEKSLSKKDIRKATQADFDSF